KQGLLGALVLAVVIGTWLASRKRRGGDQPPHVNDDLFGEPELPLAPAPVVEPERLAVVTELQEAAARRRALVALADEQPDDVARVLSGWLNSKEG
ncbi:MAG: hypothetical protein ACRDWT_13975, partial [Jatrophihabitantaceae bacterium]